MPSKTLSILALAALLLTQAACTHSDIAKTNFFRQHRPIIVEIAGEAPIVGAQLAVDINNHNGSVIVEVDDRIDVPVIKANLIRPKHEGMMPLPETDTPGIITASYEPSKGPGSTLRINAALGNEYPTGSAIALHIRLPKCDGLNIVNNGGPIIILGTGGSVTAQNGITTGIGGRIEYRTSKPLRDPVALITAGGRITAVVDPAGRALIELDTERGQTSFGSAYGSLTKVRPANRSYRGTWNDGANPFIARSADGDVTVFVKYDAEQYSTADDWMAMFGK